MELNPDDSRATPQAMLARRVRRAREKAGLSLRELGAEIRFPYSYIYRVESGQQLPSDDLAAALDKRFDLDGLVTDLLDAARDTVIQDYSRAVVRREKEAVRIQVFTSSVIPGLLQTEEYAMALFRAGLLGRSDDELQARVDARMKRKRIFTMAEPPLYWAIMDEAALKRPVGGIACMAAQLKSVLRAAETPHTTVQVLPFAQGEHPMVGGSLVLLALKEGGKVGLVESFMSGECVESPRKVAELVQFFEVACSKALSGNDSLDLIRQYEKEYKNDS